MKPKHLCAYCNTRRARLARIASEIRYAQDRHDAAESELAEHEALHDSIQLARVRTNSSAARFIEEFMRFKPGDHVDFPGHLASYERVANWATRARRAVRFPIHCAVLQSETPTTRVSRPMEKAVVRQNGAIEIQYEPITKA